MTLREVLEKVRADRLCTKTGCTTCGAWPYRKLLREAAAGGDGFMAELSELTPDAWSECEEPRGAVAFALEALASPQARATVLEHWLERSPIPTWLYDSVVFDVLRRQAVAEPGRAKWLDAAVAAALQTHSSSLVESLLWLLGSAATDRSGLIDLAGQLTEANPNVGRALAAASITESA